MTTMTLERVRDWHRSIAESNELLRAIADPHKAAADAIDAELQNRFECLAAVTDILDGKDTGVGVCNEPWQSVRMRLIELVKRQASAQADIEKMNEEQRDAERYRWLRDKCEPISGYYHLQHSRSDCDARIDAAMAKERP